MHTQKKHRSIPFWLMAFLFFLSWVIGLQVATEVFAYYYFFQPMLGPNSHNFYWPWKILEWYSLWHPQFTVAFVASGIAGLCITILCLMGLSYLIIMLRNTAFGDKTIYGSARWAGRKDIEQAGLIFPNRTFWQWLLRVPKQTQQGVYVGSWEDPSNGITYLLRHNGPEHVLTYAPTRSGKGVGLVIPTLLSWRESTVVTDLKGELWALTAGWRQSIGQKALKFEPASKNSIHWNPLDEVRFGSEHEVGDAQNLATLIVDPDGKGVETHWQKTSQSLLTGLILFVLQRRKSSDGIASLSEISFLLSDPKEDKLMSLWMEMKDDKSHQMAQQAATSALNTEKKELSSIISTARSYLNLYSDPIVANNTNTSGFLIADLMNHGQAVNLYIVTAPTDKDRLKPLVRILISSIIRILASKMEFENGRSVAQYKHRLLLMLDEFPSLGKLAILQESLAFLAGYGIKCYLICQDINQLQSKETGYGPDESITSNCHVQNAFPPNRLETAEHLSKLTGQTTVVKEQISTSGKRSSFSANQVSRHFHEVQRPLLTADECLRMKGPKKVGQDIEAPGDMLIYVAGFPTIHGKQPLYFKDKIFLERAKIPAPKTSAVLREI